MTQLERFEQRVALMQVYIPLYRKYFPDVYEYTWEPDFSDVTAPRIVRQVYPNERDRILVDVAERLGSVGWTRVANEHAGAFDWTKSVDGVLIKIIAAEPYPAPVAQARVGSHDWPILLKAANNE